LHITGDKEAIRHGSDSLPLFLIEAGYLPNDNFRVPVIQA
jgi:hypothetical protein